MSHPNGEGAQSGAEGTQSGAGENTGENGTTDTTSQTGAQSGTETNPAGETIPKAEADSLRERMRAADQRAAKLDAELKQLRDKDLPEQDKLRRDFEESQQTVQKLQTVNNELALKVAFLSDNSFSWHNPERALKLVDLSQVEIRDDGTVTGLKEALKALATSDAYLVKQAVTEEQKPPAGTAPGNNGGSGGTKPSVKGMAARIPALNTRVRRS